MSLQFVRYCRPKSSAFGNSTSKRNVRDAWVATKKFLDEYTDYFHSIQPHIELWDSSNLDELLEVVSTKYGETDISTGTPYRWYVSKKFDEGVVSLAFENEKYEKNKMGPVVVHLPLYFKWKDLDPENAELYKDVFNYFYNGSHGEFNIIVSDKVFIQSEFIIPYPVKSRECNVFIEMLRNHLPYKLSDNSLVAFYSRILKNGKTQYKAMGTLKSLT